MSDMFIEFNRYYGYNSIFHFFIFFNMQIHEIINIHRIENDQDW